MPAALLRLHLVNHTLLGIDQRGQLRQQHSADRSQVALALQHSGESARFVLSQSCSVFRPS